MIFIDAQNFEPREFNLNDPIIDTQIPCDDGGIVINNNQSVFHFFIYFNAKIDKND